MNPTGVKLFASAILCVAFAASLINPWTREIQVLTVRLLFGLSGKTVVQGQPPGCMIEEIPNVYLDRTGYLDLSDKLGPTPVAFLLTKETLPPLDSWRSISWMSLIIVFLVLAYLEHRKSKLAGFNPHRIASWYPLFWLYVVVAVASGYFRYRHFLLM